MHTGESERVCRPRRGEDMGEYYERAEEFHNLVGNAAEEARVIWLRKALRMNRGGYTIPRSAEYVIEKVKNAKKMAMKYSCKSAFHMMRKACSLHESVLEPEELEKYKLLGGWTSDANWDDELKDREAEVKSNKWVGGVPSQIRKQEASIRKHQEKQRKKWDPIMLG